MQKSNSFNVAISATKKAISEKEKKLKQLEEIEKLSMNFQELERKINEANFQLGYHGERLKTGTLLQKSESKKICTALKKELKQLNKLENIDFEKHLDKEFNLKDEIKALNQELRVLTNLNKSYSSNNKFLMI